MPQVKARAELVSELLRAGRREDLGRRTGGLVASLFLLTHAAGTSLAVLPGPAAAPPGEGRAGRRAPGFCPLPAGGLWRYASSSQRRRPQARVGNVSPRALQPRVRVAQGDPRHGVRGAAPRALKALPAPPCLVPARGVGEALALGRLSRVGQDVRARLSPVLCRLRVPRVPRRGGSVWQGRASGRRRAAEREDRWR